MTAALLKLFVLFFRIGLFSFGGGYVMLPLIFQGIQEFGFMSADEFSDLVALSQMTPGPIAINAATYVGYGYAGVPGSIAATLGVTLPSLILVIMVSHFLNKFKKSQALSAALSGIRPATVGLLASAVIFLAGTSIVNVEAFSSDFFADPAACVNPVPFIFFLASLFIFGRFKVNPIIVTLAAGIAGAFIIR